MSRKFLSVLLTVALVLCFMPVAGASSNLNIVDISILEKMDNVHSALTEASKKGIYEDTYGGMYYDKGRIILLTTSTSKGTVLSVAAYKNDSDISIMSCDYTFAELEAAWSTIVENASSIPKFVSVGISPKKNRVTLAVEDKTLFDSNKLAWFPAGVTEIVESAPILPTSTMYAGKTSYNSTRGSTSSACVGVNGPGGAGFIIQGHDTLVGDSIKPSSSDSTVGSVYSRCQPMITGREADASYVLLNSGHNFSNILDGITSANVMVPGRTFDVYVDLPVYMRARHAYPFNSGKVTLENVHYSWPDRDGNTHNYQGAQANYSAQAGDSGGLVFVYTNLGPIWAGVQSGGGAGYLSVFARATDVVSSLNVSVN